MNEVLEIKTRIQIISTKEEKAFPLLITIERGKPHGLLKKAGDHLISGCPEALQVTFFAGEQIKPDSWRSLGGKIAGWLKKKEISQAFLCCGDADPSQLLEGIMLGAFEFDRYKTMSGDPVICQLFTDADPRIIEKCQIICDAVNMARDWSHEPAAVINPWTLSDRAKVFAKEFGLKCTILDDGELRKMGAGAIVAVGQGSKTPSRMIILEYAGTKKAKPVVLVGKAITFDAGGYSIKPSDSMVGMKYDKCGAMDVLGILRAAALLKLETPLIGIICAAENMLSEKSYRPDDILTSLSGKTIEVISTDAEGRLVLADGLTYAQQNCDPCCIVDYATLTGGCVTALGHVRAGLIANNDNLANELLASGEKVWERLWRLPDDDDYFELLKSPDADMKNSGGRAASPVTGGIFLKQFVSDEVPWAHVDIAGVADQEKATDYCVPGASGFAIRLTLDWLAGK